MQQVSGGDRTGLWEDTLLFKLVKVTTLLSTSIGYSPNKQYIVHITLMTVFLRHEIDAEMDKIQIHLMVSLNP